MNDGQYTLYVDTIVLYVAIFADLFTRLKNSMA